MAKRRISKTRKKRRRGYSPHDLTDVHPPLGLTAPELLKLASLGKGNAPVSTNNLISLAQARNMSAGNFATPGGDASLEQARVESEFDMLEDARRRMEYYDLYKPGHSDMVEALKYTLRRDPEGNIPSVPQYRPGLGDLEDRKFIPGVGVHKGGRQPGTRGEYDRAYDTVAIDPESARKTLGGHDNLEGIGKVGELTPEGYMASMVSPHFLRKWGNIDPRFAPGNLTDVQMHELAGHRGTSYAFKSPHFRKHQGEFLGGKHRTRGVDDPDTPLGLQELFNRFTGKDKEYAGHPRNTREHSMVYQGTSLEQRGERAEKDLEDYVKMIGSGYGGEGLAAEQLRAMRTYGQLKNLRELIGVEHMKSLSEAELKRLLEILAAMGNPHRKGKLKTNPYGVTAKKDEPWWWNTNK